MRILTFRAAPAHTARAALLLLLLTLASASLTLWPTAAHAQTPAELAGALAVRKIASAPAAAAASEASAPVAADPQLVSQAARQTQKDDERILAAIVARLARNPAFGKVSATVQAGVARLAGSVTDAETRQLAGKLASAVQGVVAVENELTLSADFSLRLAETWEQLKDRATRLLASIPLLITAVVVVVFANGFGRWLAARLRWGRLNGRNPYLGTLLSRAVRTAFLLGGVLVALDLLEATALVTAVLGSAGVVGIVVGFAFRDVAENYLSGVLLSLRRPFEPGDHVRIDSHEGRVVSLSPRNTVLMTLDGNQLRLPNATVFKAVLLNFSHNPKRRFTFALGVGYGEDLQRAQDLGVATLAAMQGVLADPAPSASVDLVGDSSVTISYFAWVDQRETGFTKARSEAIRLVKKALEDAGMDLPEPTYRVQLVRPAEGEHAAAEPASAHVDPAAVASEQGDVSPDTDLNKQIAHERAMKADEDMLQAPGSRPD